MSSRGILLCFYNSLPLSIAPTLLRFTQSASVDIIAINSFELSRSATTYKITDGLLVSIHKGLLGKMREVPFFLNIDEATSDSNGERVLTVLVSYFEKSIGMSIVDHYKSIECIEMNTEQILTKIDALFLGEEIPWENLISDLTDSAYVKGKKSGLEVRLREKAPHLLDIDVKCVITCTML